MGCLFATSAPALCHKVLLRFFSLGLFFPPPMTLLCCLRIPFPWNLHLNSSTALPHYKQVPALSVYSSEQTVHASPQNAVCPAPWIHKKERKYRKMQALKRMGSAVAQERACPTAPRRHMPQATRRHHRPLGHHRPRDSSESRKATQFLCSSLKTTKLSNDRRVVCLRRSTAGSSNNGND